MSRKRVFLIFHVCVLFLFLVGFSSILGDELSVEDASGSPGDADVSVYVSLNNTSEVGGFLFTVHFDPARLTFDPSEVADPRLVILRTARTETFENMSGTIDLGAGTVTVLATADLLPPVDPCLSVGTGPIVEILFDVRGDAPLGDSPLDLTSASISNCAGTQEITPDLTDGTFIVVDTGECEPPDLVQPTDFVGSTGDVVYTDIVITQNEDPIDAFLLELTFDTGVLALDRVEPCDLTTDWIMVSGSEVSPGVINIGGFDTTPIDPGNTGCIARVFFEVVSCEVGETSQLCTGNLSDDLSGWVWPCCGSFTCGISCPPGDVNCDDEITPGDALCTFWRSIQDSWQPECLCDCSEQAADVNCDGHITPADALCIFWRSIEGHWRPECECTRGAKFRRMTCQVGVRTVAGGPGSELTAAVFAEGPQGVSAFRLDVGYPEELLEFVRVTRTPETREWVLLDAANSAPGKVRVGGFHTEEVDVSRAADIAEITFRVKEGASGDGAFVLSNLTDDVSDAVVSESRFRLSDGRCAVHGFALHENYPNPFNPTTTIHYTLPVAGPIHTTVTIYNTLGQEVRRLVDGVQAPGSYTVTWDGSGDDGVPVASGLYFCRLKAGHLTASRSMLLMK